ncbi:MAG: T9SS type A sorting domain-containing protein, partial [Bacteroidota bacterium]
FHDNFRLRFQAYSTFRGIFDTWNIDYVYINRLSRMPVLNSPGIFRILDRSLSGNTTPLFAPYYEVPSSQVPATFEEQVFGMSNLDIGDLHPVVFTHTLRNMNSNAVIARLEVTEGIPSLRAGEIRRIAGIPGGPFPAIEDSTVIMSEFIYVSGDTLLQERTRLTQDTVFYPSPTLELNDTLRQTYLLHQHYAYDDGTAEFSAGINLDQGQVAVQFVSRELDTLTHIDVHFPALPTTDGRPMDIVVWKDLTEDGEITRASHIVQGSSQRNEFTRIRLSRGQILQDTFYIGFQQFTDDYVGVGLDRSNEAATGKVFVNVTRDWVQNTEIVGALMMRPVFGDADDLILSSPSSAPTTPTLYPNPAETFLRIEGRYDRLEVFDLGGRQRLRSSYTTELDVSQLPRGLYIVRFYSGRDATTTKLIIE